MKVLESAVYFMLLGIFLVGCSLESSIEQMAGLTQDPAYKVSAKPSASALSEGDIFHVDLQIENPRLVPTTIRWNIVNGSSDFTISAGSIVLPSGSTMVTLNLPTLDDSLYEANEEFTLTFSSDDAAVSIQPAVLDLTVQDNDPKPKVEFQISSESVLESVGSHNIQVLLSGPSAFTSQVNYSLKASSTAQATDHTLTAGSVIFAPGEISKTITIGIVDDSIMESTENLIVELSSPDKVDLGLKTEYTLSILDNDTLDLNVAIEQSGTQTDPTYDLPVFFTVTFNRAIDPATFDISDLSQGGSAPGVSWNLSTADNRVYTLKASTASGSGTIKPELPAGRVSDLLGNLNLASTSADATVTYLPAPATFNIAGITGGVDNTVDSQLSSGNYATVRWTASTAADSYDVTIYENDGTTVKCATVSAPSPATSFNFSGCALNLASNYKASVIARRTNGYSTAASNNPFTFSTPLPLMVTLNQSSSQVDPSATLPVEFTLVFSRDIAPASLSSSDITQNGTATGVVWTLSTLDNITYVLRATSLTGEGTLVPFLDATKVTDLLGNPNQASTSTDASVLYRTKPGAFSITGVTGGADITQDNSLSSGLLATLHWSTSSNAESYDITVFENDGVTVKCPTATVSAPANSHSFAGCTLDAGTNYKASVIAHRASAPSTSATNAPYTFSTPAALSVTINQGSAQADPTNSVPVNFTVVFSRAVNPATFSAADIQHSGTATITNWTVSTSDNITWTVSATAITGEGTIIPSINAGAVQDAMGNLNLTSTSTDNSVHFWFNPTAFTISGVTGGADSTADNQLTSGLLATVNWTASTYAESYDVTVFETDGTTVKCAQINVTAPATSHNFATCVLNASTTYKARVIAKRASGGSVSASNSLYSFSTGTPLTVTVNQAGGQADPTYNLPVNFTVIFNRAVDPATFTTAHITHTGSATGVTWSLSTSDNITWNLRATAATATGTIIPSITAAAVTDPMSNSNEASTSADNSVTYNAEPAVFLITGITGGLDSTQDNLLASGDKATIHWNTSTAADNYEITIFENDNTTVKCATQTVAAPASSWSFSACALTVNTTYKAQVVATRTNGTTRVASNSLYAFTTPTPLTVTIEQAGGQSDPTSTPPVNFTVTFSRQVDPLTVSASDFTQTGTATGVVYTVSTIDNITYTLKATSVAGEGSIIPSLPADRANDAYGNMNLASTSVDASVSYYAPPGAFNITGITGATDSTLDNVLSAGQYASVNWTDSTNADSYDITIRNNADTATVCATVNVPAPATNYSFASCALTAGTNYKVLAVAKRSVGVQTTAANSPYTFSRIGNLTISSFARNTGQSSPTSTLPVKFRITFNRAIDPATFTAADIQDNGTATGITWSLSTSDNTVFIVSAIAVSNPGTLRPSITVNAVQDIYGNNNTAGESVTAGQAVDYSPPPGPFNITGITGGADAVLDNQLSSGAKATINWDASSNTTSYQITIFENDGTTLKCAQQTISAPATSYASSCVLNFSSSYKVRVRALGGTAVDASNSLYAFSTGSAAAITVTAAYPVNGANWNDYVRVTNSTLSSYKQTDTACDGTEINGFRSCVHGGEIRKADFNSQPNCAGVTAADSLNAFDWICDDSSGHAVIYSTGLKTDVGLRQLVLPTSFAANYLTVSVNGVEVAQSGAEAWWSNTVQQAPSAASSAQTLATSGTIYTVSLSNFTGRGYNINADKISLVNMPGYSMGPTFGTWSPNTSSSTGESGSDIRTVVSTGSQKFLWIETDIDTSSSGATGYGIFLNNTSFSQVRNIANLFGSPTTSNGRMISINGSHSLLIRDIKSQFDCTQNNCRALEILGSSNRIIVENLYMNITPKTPFIVVGPSVGNEFTNLTINTTFGTDRAVDITDVSNSTFTNLSLNGQVQALRAMNSNNNYFENSVLSTFDTSTVANFKGSSGNRIIGLTCTNKYNSPGCLIMDTGSNGNILHNINMNIEGTAGLILNASHENIITRMKLTGNSFASKGISLVSSSRNTFTHVTATAIFTSSGGGAVDLNASTYNTFSNVVATSARYGLNIVAASDNNRFTQIHAGGNSVGTHDIRLNNSSNSEFSKFLLIPPNNFYTHCAVSGGTNPGLTNSSCATAAPSSHVLITNVNSSSSFNASLDLLATDTVLRDRVQNGNSANSSFVNAALCPAGLDTGTWTIADQRTSPATFLINAYEDVFDNIGNNDGLCEPNESCIYTPNFGAYQGHGDYKNLSCVMPAGVWQNNIIYAYPNNGY